MFADINLDNMFTKIKTWFKKAWKWTLGVLGVGAVAIALTIPQFGATVEVDLIPTRSVSTYKFNTPDGLMHPGEYAVDDVGFMVYADNPIKFISVDTLNTTGLTKIEIADRWGKAYSYFKDPNTGKQEKYEITKEEYEILKTSKGLPSKKVTKPVSYAIKRKLASLFKIETAWAVIALNPTVSSDQDVTNITSLTVSHNSGTATNRTLVVSTLGNDATGIAVTYNGDSATTHAFNNGARVRLWYLDDPDSGTFNVVLSQTNATFMALIAQTYNDAGTVSGTASVATLTDDTPNLDITTNFNNSMVVDAITGAGDVGISATVGGSQTQSGQEVLTSIGFVHASSYIVKATAGIQSLTWTFSDSTPDVGYFVAIEVKEDIAPVTGGARRIIIE